MEELEGLAVHLFRPFFLLSCPVDTGFGLGIVCFLLYAFFECGHPRLQKRRVPSAAESLECHWKALQPGEGVTLQPVKETLGIRSCMFLGLMSAQDLSKPSTDGGELCFSGNEESIGGFMLGCLERVCLRIHIWTAPVVEVTGGVGT
jgi:hypothetical protein